MSRAETQRVAGLQLAARVVYLAVAAMQLQLLQRAEQALLIQNVALRLQAQLAIADQLASGIVQAGQLKLTVAKADDFTVAIACCAGLQAQASAAADASAVISESAGLQRLRAHAQQLALAVVQQALGAKPQRPLAFYRALGVAQPTHADCDIGAARQLTGLVVQQAGGVQC